jgi:hypothetical protein
MSDVGRIQVQTNSLKASIAYGISALGAVPLRYGKPRFISLRRKYQDEFPESRLIQKNDGVLPDIFALSSFSTISRPQQKISGNPAVLRQGVNLGRNNGALYRITGTFVEILCTSTVYSTSLDTLLEWLASIVEQPNIVGRLEFGDGGSLDCTTTVDTNFEWVDPIDRNDSGPVKDRLYNVTVSAKINTIAARISAVPLAKAVIIETTVGGTKVPQEIEVPLVDEDDWP